MGSIVLAQNLRLDNGGIDTRKSSSTDRVMWPATLVSFASWRIFESSGTFFWLRKLQDMSRGFRTDFRESYKGKNKTKLKVIPLIHSFSLALIIALACGTFLRKLNQGSEMDEHWEASFKTRVAMINLYPNESYCRHCWWFALMPINFSKTNFVIMKSPKKKAEQVTISVESADGTINVPQRKQTMKYLGVLLDETMSFNHRIPRIHLYKNRTKQWRYV